MPTSWIPLVSVFPPACWPTLCPTVLLHLAPFLSLSLPKVHGNTVQTEDVTCLRATVFSRQHYQSHLFKSLCVLVIASIISRKRVLPFPSIDLAPGT